MTTPPFSDTEDHPPFAPHEKSKQGHQGSSSGNRQKQNIPYASGIAVAFSVLGLGLLALLILGCSGGNPVVLLLVLLLLGFLLFHYFTWGRWLNRKDSRSEDDVPRE